MNHESPVADNAAMRKVAHDLSPLARAIVAELATLPQDMDYGMYPHELAQTLGYGKRAVNCVLRELTDSVVWALYDDDEYSPEVYFALSSQGRRIADTLDSLLPASV